jgi:hypothetical protein
MDFEPIELSLKAVMLLGAITPFITAVAARLRTPDWFKGLISITLAAAVGIVSAILDAPEGSTIEWQTAIENGGGVWAVHLMTYFGITSDMVKKLHDTTKTVGISLPAKVKE